MEWGRRGPDFDDVIFTTTTRIRRSREPSSNSIGVFGLNMIKVIDKWVVCGVIHVVGIKFKLRLININLMIV